MDSPGLGCRALGLILSAAMRARDRPTEGFDVNPDAAAQARSPTSLCHPDDFLGEVGDQQGDADADSDLASG